jgi:hypothetical protein
MESKRVTYLVMKKEDRLTLKQARAVLKALAGEKLVYQDKPNLRIAISKLTEAVEEAGEKDRIRKIRDAAVAQANAYLQKTQE